MPRHLISDAQEWIIEIPTVPIYYLAKLQSHIILLLLCEFSPSRAKNPFKNAAEIIEVRFQLKIFLGNRRHFEDNFFQ